MRLSVAVACAALIAVSTEVSAAANNGADVKHLHIRVYTTSGEKRMATRFGHTSIGNQCAYDPKVISAMYPCADGGVCVRTSPTYGKCFTKEEAAKLQANATRSGSDDDSSESSEEESERAVTDGSTSRVMSSSASRGSANVGDDERGGEDEDEETDEESEEDEEDEDATVPTKPQTAKAQ